MKTAEDIIVKVTGHTPYQIGKEMDSDIPYITVKECIEAMNEYAHQKEEWVSVKDRKPEIGENKVCSEPVWIVKGNAESGFYVKEAWYVDYCGDEYWEDDERAIPTPEFWQPQYRPEPPTNNEKNK